MEKMDNVKKWWKVEREAEVAEEERMAKSMIQVVRQGRHKHKEKVDKV